MQSLQVSYLLTRACVSGNQDRTNNFHEDSITSLLVLPLYKGSGYDRGHLKPADHSRCSLEDMKSSFSTLNISPQKPEFNRGIWKQLESYTKGYLNFSDSIEIICGPILINRICLKKANGISIPKQYYKAVKVNDSLLIAFVLNHKKGVFSPTDYAITINDLEKILGQDLFIGSDEKFENKIDTCLISNKKVFTDF